MAAKVDKFVMAAMDGNLDEMRRCIDAGADKDGMHREYVRVCSWFPN
jgi:hypothetical protein